MPVTLADFLRAKGKELVLASDGAGKAIGVADRAVFQGRDVRLVAEPPYGLIERSDQHRQNAAAKEAFLCALHDVYGSDTGDLVETTIFPWGWSSSMTPLSDRDVELAVDSAARINALGPSGANMVAMENFIRGDYGTKRPSPLASIFVEMRERLTAKDGWHLVEMENLEELFRNAIINDYRFARERMGFNAFRVVARDVIARWNAAGG